MGNHSVPPEAPRWTGHDGRPVLGVVMIVRDEAPRLSALFADLAGLADEVVVVDTGSTDGTLEICRDWGVTLLQRPWRDDFSHARNEGLGAATASYLIWLDGDDRVSAETASRLARLRDSGLPAAGDVAYQLTVHNLDADGRAIDSFEQVRIIPNRPAIRYRGAIHESFMEALLAERVRVETLPLSLAHHGYATPAVRRAKAERNARLLRRAVRDEPGDVHARVHLAQALAGLGEHREAADLMAGVLERAADTRGHEAMLAELRVIRAGYLLAAGDAAGAARELDDALRLRPRWGVAAVRRAELDAREQRWERAAARVESDALDFAPGAFGSPVERLRDTREWMLGRALLEGGRAERALEPLRSVLRRDPAATDARLDLGQALLELGRFAEARETLEPLGSDEAAMPRLFEVLTAIALARAAGGSVDAAAACLSPLVELLAVGLADPDGATLAELAAVLDAAGQHTAARNLGGIEAILAQASAG